MKKLVVLILLSSLAWTVQAQYPTVTIQQIQTVSAQALANCVDTINFSGDTVITHGTVVMDGGISQSPADNRNVWIQSGSGSFSGIDLYTIGVPVPVPGTDVLDLIAGDSVEITGIVTTFANESELIPLNINVLAISKPVFVNPIGVSDLNDNTRTNNLVTGEQWEGAYVELTNVTVATVDPFTSGGVDRVSFNVQDASGNLVNISDRFLAQRLPSGGGAFTPPTAGTVYDTIRGVVSHSGNGCTGGTGRGYEIYPFDAADYVVAIGLAPPQIGTSQRSPITPTGGQDISISATITDVDGTVNSATLYYAVGVGNNTFQSIPMTSIGGGSTYQANIPSSLYNDGDLVKYYICADDNDALTGCNPDVPGGIFDPQFFRVRDNGLTIADVQFTPYTNGNSGYRSLEVTLRGVVTASAEPGNLGFVYIQQAGETAWAGIPLVENTALASLVVGDSVEVTGIVQEAFGLTRLEDISSVNTISSGNAPPAPVEVDPGVFSIYDFAAVEQYEGMLVTLKNAAGGPMYVVAESADGGNNFGEYRIGTDLFDPLNGSRVIAGRQDGNASSSLNFSHINDSTWISTAGTIDTSQLPICVVTYGDSMESLTGIMYYSFSAMKLLPRNNADVTGFKGANCPDGIISGIEDELEGSTFTAYPNPTMGTLYLDYTFTKPVNGSAVLLDLMGRTLGAKELDGIAGTVGFETHSLTAGTYLIRISADNTPIEFKKVVILK